MLFRGRSGKWTDRGLACLSEKIVDKSQREVSVWYLAGEIVLLPFLEKACHTHTCHTHARAPSLFHIWSGKRTDRGPACMSARPIPNLDEGFFVVHMMRSFFCFAMDFFGLLSLMMDSFGNTLLNTSPKRDGGVGCFDHLKTNFRFAL